MTLDICWVFFIKWVAIGGIEPPSLIQALFHFASTVTLELVISHQYRTVACTRIWTSLHGTYIPASPSSSNVCPLSCTHNKPEKIAYANKSNLTTFFTTLVSHIVRRQVMTPAFQSFMYNYELRRLWSYTDSCIITRLYADSEEPFFLCQHFSDISQTVPACSRNDTPRIRAHPVPLRT